jgi:hypothetical protein
LTTPEIPGGLMTTINSAESWWSTLIENQDKIIGILHRFIPVYLPSTVTPGDGGSPIVFTNGRTVSNLERIFKSIQDKNHETLLTYLSAAFGSAPNKPEIHKIPGWHILCELLSESYVLYDDNTQ